MIETDDRIETPMPGVSLNPPRDDEVAFLCAVFVSSREHETALLPEHRSAGVGGGLMRWILGKAAVSGRRITGQYTPYNPARTLYRRLGLQETGMDGPLIELKWWPDPRQKPGQPERVSEQHVQCQSPERANHGRRHRPAVGACAAAWGSDELRPVEGEPVAPRFPDGDVWDRALSALAVRALVRRRCHRCHRRAVAVVPAWRRSSWTRPCFRAPLADCLATPPEGGKQFLLSLSVSASTC